MHQHTLTKRMTLFAILMLVTTVKADPLFFDDFNDGFSGWTSNGYASSSTQRALVPYSVRFRGSGSTLSRSFSTLGWQDVEIGFFVAARSLEGSDRCIVEVSSNGGSSWVEAKTLDADQDDDQPRWATLRSPAYDNNPDLRLRYRAAVNSYAGAKTSERDKTLSER